MQHDPELIILDEPSTGLDPLMQKSLWDVLKEHNQQGVTVFISSHVLSEVQAFCKNASIIREGEIVIQDSIYNLGNKAARRVTLRNVKGEIPVLPIGVVEQKRTSQDFSFLYEGEKDDPWMKFSYITIAINSTIVIKEAPNDHFSPPR